MNVSMTFEKPMEIRATLEATMTLDQWMLVRSALSKGPFHADLQELSDRIGDLVVKACNIVHEGKEAPPDA